MSKTYEEKIADLSQRRKRYISDASPSQYDPHLIAIEKRIAAVVEEGMEEKLKAGEFQYALDFI